MKIKRDHGFIVILLIILISIVAITHYYRKPYVRIIGKNSVKVYAVQHRPSLQAEFIVITRIGSKTIVEIMRSPGLEGVEVINGENAQKYLRSIGLD